MTDAETAIRRVRTAFAATPYPGDAYLLGSREGDEPFDQVEPFRGRDDWTRLDAGFLDARGGALSFFSEGAFRFFLPAFLVADLQGGLDAADPLFHLTYAFVDREVPLRVGAQSFVRPVGRSALLNPRRYGALRSVDWARTRLSVFTREEAGGVVAYLEARRDADPAAPDAGAIEAALADFWRERARHAPTNADLARHLERERAYLEAISDDAGG